MDGRRDGRTDKAAYRDARTHVKRKRSTKEEGKGEGERRRRNEVENGRRSKQEERKNRDLTDGGNTSH